MNPWKTATICQLSRLVNVLERLQVSKLRLFTTISMCTLAVIFFQNCSHVPSDYVEAPAEVEYGSEGSYSFSKLVFDNEGNDLTVFLPESENSMPIVFFAHGFGAVNSDLYTGLISHIASKGFIVVYPSTPVLGSSNPERYEVLFSGYVKAVSELGEKADITRVGFIGHSFGGGAVPYLAYKGVVEKGWGANGSFIYAMAPWYSFELSSEMLASMPNNSVLLQQVYADDVTNDHRMAIDIYDHFGSKNTNKYFHYISSVSYGDEVILAEHNAPSNDSHEVLRKGAVYNVFDALADLAFNGTDHARDWLSQPSATIENYMPIVNEPSPVAKFPESRYSVKGGLLGGPWSHELNPRYTPVTCSSQTIENQMSDVLQNIEVDTDYSLRISNGQGKVYTYNHGTYTMNTSHKIASATKMISATAIMWVVERTVGFDLDDRISEHYPAWSAPESDPLHRITLSDLLDFSSGLVNEPNCIKYGATVSFDQCVQNVLTENLGGNIEPGTEFQYQGTHLHVAGAMAIAAGGYADWHELFNAFKSQFNVLDTAVYDKPSLINPRIGGGLTLKGSEYVEFLERVMNKAILSAPMHDQMFSNQSISKPDRRPILFPDKSNEHWQYGYGNWLECSVKNCIDPMYYSSLGLFGAYPLISFNKAYVGYVARVGDSNSTFNGKLTFDSVRALSEQWASCPND